MKSAPTVFVLAGVLQAGAAGAATVPPPDDHRYEVTLVFGASVLGVETEESLRGFPIDVPGTLLELLPAGTLRQLVPEGIRQQERLGGSFLQGFQVARRVGRRGWLETEFLIAPAHTLRRSVSFRCPAQLCALAGLGDLGDGLSVEQRVTAYHYGLGFGYELARGDVRPFLSAGVGAVTYDEADGGGTSLALEVGAGARFAISDHVGGRLEVVDRIVPDHFLTGNTEHDLQVRAGAVFRLP
jgi:opacity protein-like surface antigen